MSVLILAEHNNLEVKSSTLSAISAASKITNDIEVLIIGYNIENISKEISNYQNVSKVLTLDNEKFEHSIAENIEPVVVSLAAKYSHIFAPDGTYAPERIPFRPWRI